jgi:hypothetical protein
MSVMRSLEFTTTPEFPFPRFYKSMQDRIGQMVYDAPDIFSYFSSDSQPDGVIGRSGLVSPEMIIHTTTTIMGLMSGLMNIVKYGMDRCYGGFGQAHNFQGDGEVKLTLSRACMNRGKEFYFIFSHLWSSLCNISVFTGKWEIS